MRYLAQPYHVGLLSAAAIHGAAHQQPMVFHVVTATDTNKVGFLDRYGLPCRHLQWRSLRSVSGATLPQRRIRPQRSRRKPWLQRTGGLDLEISVLAPFRSAGPRDSPDRREMGFDHHRDGRTSSKRRGFSRKKPAILSAWLSR
ncbi:type IV toxin-antitoxin system AbiEi family antitoxin [bacterium]|nr:type IV toxin-antitoxin system AbiEi family antitoxin [bacterium]